MSLADIVRQSILDLDALEPKPVVAEKYLFVLRDIQKTILDKAYSPHFYGEGWVSSDPRGEGCYTALGYHAGWGGYSALPAETDSPLDAYRLFYSFIDSFSELHDRNDTRYVQYNTLLQGYKTQLDKPINDLSYAAWQREGRIGLIQTTEETINALARYPSSLSNTYQDVLNKFRLFLNDKRNPLELQAIKAQFDLNTSQNVFTLPKVEKNDLPALLLLDDYIKSLKHDYPNTENEKTEHWGEMFSFINLLHDYRLNVLQDTQNDSRIIPGLISEAQNKYFFIPPANSLYQQIQDIVQTLNSVIGDAATKWVEDRDKARRRELENSKEQGLLLTLFLCLIDPLLGCCFCCCNELLTQAELEARKDEDERFVAEHLAFLTHLSNGLEKERLCYNDLPYINQGLERFKGFVSVLPDVKKIDGRFRLKFIDWLCNLLNKYFSAGFESRKVKKINTQLTLWKNIQPQLTQEKSIAQNKLDTDKRNVLHRETELTRLDLSC